MNEIITICIFIESILIIGQFWFSIRSKDPSRIWSPINIISLVYIYYCIIPHFYSGSGVFAINEEANNGYLFHIASLLSYIFILLGFSIPLRGHGFTKWNVLINERNAIAYGLFFCVLGFVCYSIVHGFSFSIFVSGNVTMTNNGFEYYLDSLIELFPVGIALLVCGWKRDKKQIWVFIVIWLCFVTLVLRGSRGRMIMTLLPLLVMWHNYPVSKKVNYFLMATLMAFIFLFFAVMDLARVYYGGLDIERANQVSLVDASRGAGENYTVYSYSMLSIDKANSSGERFYFAPIINAIFMPIPRALFPWKPNAEYLMEWEAKMYGDNTGNALLNIVESYLSFGWIGVCLFAWFLGWLARKFWDNFQRNRQSIGAITLLGVFDGMCYIIISRGYLAQSFSSFLYSICLPFWLMTIISRFSKIKK